MADNVQERRNCYHESGHAVAWVINGDTLRLVVVDPGAPMTEEQRELSKQIQEARTLIGDRGASETGGYTVVRVKERACSRCEGAITTNLSNPLAANFRLSDGCSTCMELLTNHVACIFAGGAATSHIEHGTSDVDVANSACRIIAETRHDRREVDRILSGLASNEQQRTRLKEDAQNRASRWMVQESKAALALADALLRVGVMDGAAAEQIIEENLSRATAGGAA